MIIGDFPGDAVDRNPSANTRDMGSIPGPEILHATEKLSPCATSTEPVLWSPGTATTEALMSRVHAVRSPGATRK